MTSIKSRHFTVISSPEPSTAPPHWFFKRKGKKWQHRKYRLTLADPPYGLMYSRRDEVLPWSEPVRIPWRVTCALIQALRRRRILKTKPNRRP